MSELENIKPVAFYRADWKGDMMFRKDNTVVIRKNEGDFTTGWIKPLYDELPESQPHLTIPKNIAKKIDKFIKVLHFLNEFEAINFLSAMDLNGDRTPQWLKDNPMLVFAYLAGKALGVDLVKVGEG